jgi:hypothetical protein
VIIGTVASDYETCSTVEIKGTEWWIDKGATKQMTNCPNYLMNFEAGHTPLQAVGARDMKVKSDVGNKSKMLLKNVLFVPGLVKNLFSVLAAHEINPTSKFLSGINSCSLQVHGEKIVKGKHPTGGGLYKALIEPVMPERQIEINSVIVDDSTPQLYHERFGHQDKRYIRNILEKEFQIKVKVDSSVCEPCMYGKAHRLPFGRRNDLTIQELLSADVCDPFKLTFQGKSYVVLFKDNYSKYRYVYLLKENQK